MPTSLDSLSRPRPRQTIVAASPLHELLTSQKEILDPRAKPRTSLQRAVRHAASIAGAKAAVLALAEHGELRIVTGFGSAPLRSALFQAASQRWSSLRRGPDLGVDLESDHELRTDDLLCVPLGLRGKSSVGILAIARPRWDAVSEAGLMSLQLLAGQIAAAVRRAQLTDKLRQSKQQHEQALVASEGRFRRLFFETAQPMWLLDAETQRFLAVNRAAVTKYGYSVEEFTALTIASLREDAKQLAHDYEAARVASSSFQAQHRLKDGRLIAVEVSTTPGEWEGRPVIVSLVNDVTERNRLERELRDGSFRDPLTGGANRALFMERAEHALRRTKRRRVAMAMLLIDLDHFKDINDTMGYEVGDELLRAVAKRLEEVARGDDTVARLSADEFAVLLEEVDRPDRALQIAERLRDAFSRPVEFGHASLGVGVSIGVATSSLSPTDAGELLHHAQLALHAAKAAGRGRVQVFEPGMHASISQRVELDQDLRHAVERGELRLAFQPVFAVESGTLVGCEALARWNHPSRGLIPPDTFIPLAESNGVISAIDSWVLETACAQLVEWRAAGLPDLFVAVNTSGRDLGQAELVDRVAAALLATRLSPDRLEIEITESVAVAQPAEALGELRRLRESGISVAIDDFGTGYSSLSKLASFPVDRIKIDRSFLSAVRNAEDDAPLVAAMIGLAHQLGLQVTAEGVETGEQLAFLRRHGCDLLQGYLFSRPLPPDQFVELLLHGRC